MDYSGLETGVAFVFTFIAGIAAAIAGLRPGGKKGFGDGLLWLSVFLLAGWLAFAWRAHGIWNGEVAIWHRGWVGSPKVVGAIQAGIIRDQVGLLSVSVMTLVVLFIGLNRNMLQGELRKERLFSGFIFGLFGASLTWVSTTIWLSLIGICCASFGGLTCLATRWHEGSVASVAVRYARERVWGILIAMVGSLFLAGSGASFLLQNHEYWTSELGAWILAVGILILLSPYPLLGWTVAKTDHFGITQMLGPQIFVGWAAMAILIRYHEQFTAVGVFPSLGWVALASVLITAMGGLVEVDWKKMIARGVSSSLLLSVVLLSMVGQTAGVAFLWGSTISLIVLALCGTRTFDLEERVRPKVAFLFATFVAGWFGTGLIFSVASNGLLLVSLVETRTLAPHLLFFFSYFLVAALIWKVVWKIYSERRSGAGGVVSEISLLGLLLLASGWVWTGSGSGGVLQNGVDSFMPSFLAGMYSKVSTDGARSEWVTLLAITFLIALGALFLAYILQFSRRKKWDLVENKFLKFKEVLVDGRALDAFFGNAFNIVLSIENKVEHIVGEVMWQKGILKFVSSFGYRLSIFALWIDRGVVTFVAKTLRISIDVPAKALQLVQNGNVQWYLFFAVGTGLAILAHFLIVWRS